MGELRYEDWLIKLLNKKNLIKEAMIEITSRCNYSCVHCFRNTMFSENFGDVDPELYKKALNELKKIGTETIVFSGWGEPLVHPNFLEFCTLAKDLGFKVILTTNGALLFDYLDDIIKIGVDKIVVSIDSPREDIYDIIRKNGKLYTVLDALKAINKIKSEKNLEKPKVAIQYTIMKMNCHLIPELPELSKYGVEEIILSHPISLSKDVEKKISCILDDDPKARLDRYIKEALVKANKLDVLILVPRRTPTAKRVCPFVNKRAIFISWTGDVSPCIYYAHNWRLSFNGVERTIYKVTFGNILEKPIEDIINDKDFLLFRFKTRFLDYSSCLDCELVNTCLLTRTNRFDCYGNEPTCSSCPFAHDIVRCPL